MRYYSYLWRARVSYTLSTKAFFISADVRKSGNREQQEEQVQILERTLAASQEMP